MSFLPMLSRGESKLLANKRYHLIRISHGQSPMIQIWTSLICGIWAHLFKNI